MSAVGVVLGAVVLALALLLGAAQPGDAVEVQVRQTCRPRSQMLRQLESM